MQAQPAEQRAQGPAALPALSTMSTIAETEMADAAQQCEQLAEVDALRVRSRTVWYVRERSGTFVNGLVRS
jgi:hypothetical protein